MKTLFQRLAGILLVVVVLASCKKTLFPAGINTDPNASTKDRLLPNVLLPGAEYSIAYTVGGDVSRFTSVFIQSVRGAARQFKAYDQYVFTAQDFDNCWSNFYTQGLNNLYTLKELAVQNGYAHYSGIAKVLLAYEVGLASDLWGDVPYSEAFRGDSSVLQPKYDSQQDIYDSVFSLLSSAITDLGAADSQIEPGDDDFIYGGVTDSWIKLAYSLEARFYIHLSKVDNSYADKALAAAANGFTGNSDNAAVPFFDDGTEANPWYQYVTQRGDISYDDGYLYQFMSSKSDPRLNAYFDLAGNGIGDAIGAYNAPVSLMTYSELKFIEAEAHSAKGDGQETAAYNAAVGASFDALGLNGSTYLAANPLTGADHATRLQTIIAQKYVALFSEPEPLMDWKRTGLPALTATTGANIPRRFIYVQAELDHNGNNVPKGLTLFSNSWWDK
ncbi:MAG TPA: SusD/RagB family nutrient-binding outer membrane lipoprotein [Puia sp.]|nr:SusD/RagB family nutrient-binding outer membrane lipoprotein [Puia sp.]